MSKPIFIVTILKPIIMKVSDQAKTIAESIGCTFFEGTFQELNIDIERGNIDKDAWVFGLITPDRVTDELEIDNPSIYTTYPFSGFVAKQSNEATIDHRTKDMQPTYDAALKLVRSFVHQFSSLPDVNQIVHIPQILVTRFLLDFSRSPFFGFRFYHLQGFILVCKVKA